MGMASAKGLLIMVYSERHITQPGEANLRITNPEQHIIDLTFIIQNVTDQSKSIGALQQELVHLKESTAKNCGSVDSQLQRIVAIETTLKRLERDFDKFPDTLKSSVDEIKRLIESSATSQKEHLDLKLAPLTKSVDDLKSDSKDKIEKLIVKIDDLNQFRWKLLGISTVIAVLISAGVVFASRAFIS